MATPKTLRESQKAAALLAARAHGDSDHVSVCASDFTGYSEMARGMMFVAEYVLGQLARELKRPPADLASEIAVMLAGRMEELRHPS